MIGYLALAFLVGMLFGLNLRDGFTRLDRLTGDMYGNPHAYDPALLDYASAPHELPATERIQYPPTQAITPTRLICAEGKPCTRHSPALCLREIPCCHHCPVA